jgi:hypothetical protein
VNTRDVSIRFVFISSLPITYVLINIAPPHPNDDADAPSLIVLHSMKEVFVISILLSLSICINDIAPPFPGYMHEQLSNLLKSLIIMLLPDFILPLMHDPPSYGFNDI